LYGVIRSILMYYGIPFRAGRMARFYRQLVRPGDLCFDLGAHAGNRVLALRRIGARVVAAEPQPDFARLLRLLYGRDPAVTILESAVGAEIGQAAMLVSARTPTVTTLSAEWAQAVGRAKSFGGVKWQHSINVPVTTLDALIAGHGLPTFCKIDVEGYELEVLRGLSQPIRTLSLEVIPAAVDIGLGCIARLGELSDYEYNWSRGETQRLAWPEWIDEQVAEARLGAMSVDAPSGDLYARRRVSSPNSGYN
jgi:FkbM family methyltransferase